MDNVKKYGSTQEEDRAVDMHECRQIVKVIMDYGVSQTQLLRIIGLLALELENRDYMQQVSSLAKRLEAGDSKKSGLITEVK